MKLRSRRWVIGTGFGASVGVGLMGGLSACGGGGGGGGSGGGSSSSASSSSASLVVPDPSDPVLTDLSQRMFNFFWDKADPTTGLIPDRWPNLSVASIAATGFGLGALVVGSRRALVTRAQAATRALKTLRTLNNGPQGPQATGVMGYKGFFYHFLDLSTGLRAWNSELSSIDTALLMMGVLACGAYFDGATADEIEIRQLSTSLFNQMDWSFLKRPSGLIGHGWSPEGGYISYEWSGYNEALMVYLLAMAAPTPVISLSDYNAYTTSFEGQWGTFQGQTHVQFGPLFGHQYSHIYYDFRGLRDAFMRNKGLDYFENSARATLAQRGYGRANPQGFTAYGEDMWGLSACDGPADLTTVVGGQSRSFKTYAARGVTAQGGFDDGTLCPSALVASVNFCPAEVYQALVAMNSRYGADIRGVYGFYDSFNPSFTGNLVPSSGSIKPLAGWVGPDYLGIDQGAALLMLDNYQTGGLWSLMRAHPVIKTGLQRAGFQASDSRGSWLGT